MLAFFLPAAAADLTPLSSVSGRDVETGQTVTIDLKNPKKATALLFLSAACPCTNGAMKDIREQARKKIKDGFHIYGISVDHEAPLGSLAGFYKKADLGFPIIHDEGLKFARAFGIKLMAEAVVIGPDLKVLYRGGIRTEKQEMILFQALDSIAAGKEPNPKTAEGLGCFLLYPEATL